MKNSSSDGLGANWRWQRKQPTVVSQTWRKTEGSCGEYRETVESNVMTTWPKTFPHEWCGEYKPQNAEVSESGGRTPLVLVESATATFAGLIG